MGQVFLTNPRIAASEAEHALGKVVLEMGPGPGILTRALLKKAKKVIAVEKDAALYRSLSLRVRSRKLKLINKDFFDATDEELELPSVDIMISNIPYSLSSKTIEWLSEKKMQAVLCLQKEFVDHMLANEDTNNYSRLSVMTALSFRVTRIFEVSRGNFKPNPLVDSSIIYIKPIASVDPKDAAIISALMQHKKKTVRKAIVDSSSSLGIDKQSLASAMDKIERRSDRVFKIPPKEMLPLAQEIRRTLE